MISLLCIIYLKIVVLTSRIRIQASPDPALAAGASQSVNILHERRPAVFTYWHRDALCVLQPLGSRAFCMMLTTKSRKDVLATIAPRFGLRLALGSLDGGGRHALITLLDRLKLGDQVCLSADGTTGVRELCKAGPLILAQESGYPIIALSARARFSIRIRADEATLLVPLPFNRITVTLAPPLEVTKHYKFAELEDVKTSLKNLLDRLSLTS